MNFESSSNRDTGKDRGQQPEAVAAKATIGKNGSCFDDQTQNPQSNNVTTLISGDLTADPLYQILCTPFAKKSEKTKVLKSFMKTDMNVHFARHCDHIAAQAVLNKLTEDIKEKHGYWGAEDCAIALLKLYYLLKQPGNQGRTHAKEAQRIVDLLEKCEKELDNPSKPPPTVPEVVQGARNHLPSAPSSISYFSEWEEDWTADPAYLALQSPFIRKSERVAVIKSFVNKHPSESFKRNLHRRARKLFEEVNQDVKRDRYHWNVHLCATTIIRLHRLVVEDNADKSPPNADDKKPPKGKSTKVVPSHVQRLINIYEKCVLKSKEMQEKKLDGALKPGCTLEDFDKQVEDRYVESFKKMRTVSLQEMREKRKREMTMIGDCAVLLACLRGDEDKDNERQEDQEGGKARGSPPTRKQRAAASKNDVVASATRTSTSPRKVKKLKSAFGQHASDRPVVASSPARPRRPPPPLHHPGRVPSVLYDPALAPSSWTGPPPQQFFYQAATPNVRVPNNNTYTANRADPSRGRDPPRSAAFAPLYPAIPREAEARAANVYNGGFRNAYTAPAPPPPSFYNSYAPIMPSFQQKSVASRVLDYALLELAGARADVVRYEQLRLAVATLTSGDPVVNQVLEDLYRSGVVSLEQLVQFTLSFGTREGHGVPRAARATF